MTFRRLLPIIIVVAIVAGIGVIFLNLSDGSEAESGVESVAYGEHSKEIVVDDAAEVTGDLADYVSVVPGTYKLSYVSEEKGKYGNQEFVITLKLKLIKQYPHDPSSYQKLKFLTSRGTIGGLKLDLSRGSLDQTESDRFEKFVKEGNEGDEKEFMFYNSMSNREYADALFNEAHGIIFETDGYESTTSSSSTSSESMSSSSSSSSTSSSNSSSASSTSSSTTSSESTSSTTDEDDNTDDDDNFSTDFEEDYKIDLDLDEYESYVEQYKECDNKRSLEALELYSKAQAYGLKLKAKKSKMSSEQKERLQSISSRL
ncbi:MAG: hypothetical protein IKJ52_10340 [Muribaculaceae bacterium]|nr:hypothetical protein [Muribaculaceae bacterium]